jgi:hypothetical protein
MPTERCFTGTLAEMQAVAAAVNKGLGYPMRGVNRGGGRHVASPATWNGSGATPPGWTKSASAPVDKGDGTAVLVVTHVEAELSNPVTLSKLTAAERTAISRPVSVVDVKAILSK